MSFDSDYGDPKLNIDKCIVWQDSEIPTIALKLYSMEKNHKLVHYLGSVNIKAIVTSALR